MGAPVGSIQHTLWSGTGRELDSGSKYRVCYHSLESWGRSGDVLQQHSDKRPQTKAQGKSPEGSKEASLAHWRFCTDFRALNRFTADSHYNIPDLQELVESFAEHKPNFITTLDLSHGFHQIAVEPESTKYTAFNTCYGTYKYLRLPMGLKTSPNTMQLLMDRVLKGLTFKSCLSYLDDLVITSPKFDQHLEEVKEVFSRLREANLKIGPKKCSFAQNKSVFLGHFTRGSTPTL